MKIYISIVFLTLTALLYSKESYSQRTPPKQTSLEALPRVAIDTIKDVRSSSSIIIYSNGTWGYLHSDLEYLNSLETLNNHWDTTQIFSYKSIELSDLPSVVELKLVSQLSEFAPPVVGKIISKYGPRRRANHNGVDIPLKKGEPLFSTFDGKIRYARYNAGGYGYLVIIRHPNGLESWYAHLSRINVSVGESVKVGQVIGFAGNTGRSRGNHLHFELRYKDQTFDPEFLIDFEGGILRYQTFALEKSFFNIRSRASEILEEEDDEYYTSGALYAEAADSTSIVIAAKAADLGAKKAAVISETSSNTIYHTVRSGDMLGKLAVRYGVSIDKICKLNNINRTTVLRLNQKLRIK